MVVHFGPDLGKAVNGFDQLKDGALGRRLEVVAPGKGQVDKTRDVLFVGRVLDHQAFVAANVQRIQIEKFFLHADALFRLFGTFYGHPLHFGLDHFQAQISARFDTEAKGLDLAHQVGAADLGFAGDLGFGRPHLARHLALGNLALLKFKRLGQPWFAHHQVHRRGFGGFFLFFSGHQVGHGHGQHHQCCDNCPVEQLALTPEQFLQTEGIRWRGKALERIDLGGHSVPYRRLVSIHSLCIWAKR